MIEPHPQYAEQDPATLRAQALMGSPEWRAVLRTIWAQNGVPIDHADIDFQHQLAAYKRQHPQGAEATRPVHVGRPHSRARWQVWMDDAQRAALAEVLA